MIDELTKNNGLVSELKILIEQRKLEVSVEVNAAISMLYWEVGNRINKEILKEQRATYGKQIINSVSKGLTAAYGNGWGEKHIRHCLRTAETFQNKEIFYALSRELSWTHIRTVMYMDDDLKRSFYVEMCRLEKWSTRGLQERINSMLFERTAISKKPATTIQNDLKQLSESNKLTHDLVFRDPYFLNFLGLKDTYSEKDLEGAILAELQRFISELGSDFAFLARQKRIQIDNRDYYIDLLFYHRKLKSLVAIDLKIGAFDAAYKGEMELYLAYLEKYEMNEGENQPIGLILCAEKNPEHIELLQLHNSNIKVADYFTILPSKEILLNRLQRAIEIAQNQIGTSL